MSQKITPFLWFDHQAEEAAKFYISVFKKGSKMGKIARYGDAGPGPKGTVMSVIFKLQGQTFYALNGGPLFKFNPAISFFVDCKTQKEVDYYWEKLSHGGRKDRCGWLVDKYGVSWQIVPDIWKYLNDKDPVKSQRAMKAMLQMNKLDVKKLKEAYQGGRHG
jgi:predicted 3-demethylubiquinone-9 3-methyltransferase (glyoxalase superfamily)